MEGDRRLPLRRGYHREVPAWLALRAALDQAQAKLTCSANSLWVDAQLGGVRRCVRDRLCPPPLVDEGYTEQPSLVIEDVVFGTEVHSLRSSGRSRSSRHCAAFHRHRFDLSWQHHADSGVYATGLITESLHHDAACVEPARWWTPSRW